MTELAKEHGWKVAQNVAAGVGGLVVWPLWFAMDWQGTANTEAAALHSPILNGAPREANAPPSRFLRASSSVVGRQGNERARELGWIA